LGILVGLIVFVITDVWADSKRLTSLAGMMLLLLLGFLTSKNPSKVCPQHTTPLDTRLVLLVQANVMMMRYLVYRLLPLIVANKHHRHIPEERHLHMRSRYILHLRHYTSPRNRHILLHIAQRTVIDSAYIY